MLEARALKEADGAFGRIKQSVENAAGMKFPTTPLAGAATVGAVTGGTIAGVGVAPLLGGAATGLAAYGGVKWLTSPQGRQLMMQLTRLAEQNPALRPDVAIMTQLAAGAEEGRQEVGVE